MPRALLIFRVCSAYAAPVYTQISVKPDLWDFLFTNKQAIKVGHED